MWAATRPAVDRGVAEVVAEGGGELLFGAGSVSEDGERGVEGAVGYVVAFGPVLPGGEGLDVEPRVRRRRAAWRRGGRWCRRCGAWSCASRWSATAWVWRSMAGAVRWRVRSR